MASGGANDRFSPFLDRVPAALRDEGACVEYLFAARWPEGFRCPGCGNGKAWALQTKAWTWECAGCGKQTSVTAGTIMHHSKLPMTTWFWATYLMATHSNGISALQLQRQLALGSYKTAWLMYAKLRRSMLTPDRSPLAGLVEVDETKIACRSKHDPSPAAADAAIRAKCSSSAPSRCGRRCRPWPYSSGRGGRLSTSSLHPFIAQNLAAGAIAKTDGWSAYPGAPGVSHDPHVIGKMAAHVVLPWVHRIFSNLKVWALGVYHGLRRRHLQSYLDEFVFRFNRRRSRHAGPFRSLLGIAAGHAPVTYQMLISPEASASAF